MAHSTTGKIRALTRLTDSAVQRLLTSMLRRATPGGCILVSNALAQADKPTNSHWKGRDWWPRTEYDLARIASDLGDERVAGHAVFLDESKTNICLELHIRTRCSSRC